MSEPVSVLIVDDSALMRNIIKKIVSSDKDLYVAGIAMNGRFAQQKIPLLKPDIIVLDLEMPEINGIEFLKWRKEQNIEIPVIILSAIATKGAGITMEALALGASDFITKPQGKGPDELNEIGKNLINLLKAYGADYKRRQNFFEIPASKDGISDSSPLIFTQEHQKIDEKPVAKDIEFKRQPFRRIKDWPEYTPEKEPVTPEIILIGISTGGPNALREVLPKISSSVPAPILVVQHMPAGFTKEFANSLDKISSLEVKEAEDGDILKGGRVLIAPGDKHLKVEKKPLAIISQLSAGDTVNGHRPSVGVLFDSVSSQFQNRCMAIIMTGMGKDGSREIGEIFREGGLTIAQDESSCVVYGMPRVAVEHGYIRDVVPLDEISTRINEQFGI